MNQKKKKLFVSILAGFMALIMLLGLIVSIIPTASAQSSSEIQAQIDALQEDSNELSDQYDALEAQKQDNYEDMENIVAEKKNIENQINLLFEKIDNVNEQIAAYNTLIADKQIELDAAQERFNDLNEKNKERIRSMEEDGSLSYWSVLFKANSFADFLDRLNMIEEIAAADNKRIKELSQAADALQDAKDQLSAEKADLETTKEDLRVTEQQLDAKKQEAQQMLDLLLEREAEYAARMMEVEEANNALIAEIAQLEYEYTLAKQAEWEAYMATMTTPPTTAAPTYNYSNDNDYGDDNGNDYDDEDNSNSSSNSSGYYESSEYFICPVNYTVVTDPYGWRTHPIYGYQTFHSGVDLAANEWTPIYAAKSGYVTTSTYHWSFGNYVTINHGDGYSSMYAHMVQAVVSSGEYVYQGQLIGYVGSTGESTGPHLHFVIYYNGDTVNPMAYI